MAAPDPRHRPEVGLVKCSDILVNSRTHILCGGNPGRRPEVDIARAIELRGRGMTWPAVARQLSTEAGRHPEFHGQSVATAVYRATREQIT